MKFMKDKLILYSLIVAFFGFLDATYLTITHYKNIIPPCSLSGCEKVLTSAYSMIGPIPVALTGTLFFLGMIIICLAILIEKKISLLKLYYLGSITGFIVSVVFFLIQYLIIHAFCQYCLLSEVISTGLLILSLLKLRQDKKLEIKN
jgi:uncharacterized membrane protein